MTPVPTEPKAAVYRTRDGKELLISQMNAVDLMTALFDMLMRKAKHNHKLNKMLEVGDVLSGVTKDIHVELSQRKAELSDLPNLQAMADLGKLQLQQDEQQIYLKAEQ